MPITRTIYTQGAVSISGSGIVQRFLSGVQSANFTVNSPKQDVNEQGVLGSINKVQLEPISASAEVTFILSDKNSGILTRLIESSKLPNPQYYDVTISGIGQVKSGILSYFTVEAAVGNIPQMVLRFEGQSGVSVSAGSLPSGVNTATLTIVTPEQVSGINYITGSTCAQTMRINWEMPVERLNCLGSPIDRPTLFTRPPGTAGVALEGLSHPDLVSSVDIGIYSFIFNNMREVSRANNMAVGESATTFNSQQENTALSLTVLEGPPTDTAWVNLAAAGDGSTTLDGNAEFFENTGAGSCWDSATLYSVGMYVDVEISSVISAAVADGVVYFAIVDSGGTPLVLLGAIQHVTGIDTYTPITPLRKILITKAGYPAIHWQRSTGTTNVTVSNVVIKRYLVG